MVPKQRRDDGYRWLLRARRERPRGCRPAEQRDELASSHELPQTRPQSSILLDDCVFRGSAHCVGSRASLA